MELLLNLTQQVDNCSTYFLERYPRNSTEIAALHNISGSLLAANVSLPGINREQLQEVDNLLNPRSPDKRSLWDLLENARDTAEQVEAMIGQFDWDVFQPVVSEAEMEKRARTTLPLFTRGDATVLAGVAFHGIASSTEKLKNVSLSIRLNSTFVRDTGSLKNS